MAVVDHVAVFQGYTLGNAGGAGGVEDDVSVFWPWLAHDMLSCGNNGQSVGCEDAACESGHFFRHHVALAENHAHLGVTAHIVQTVGREVWVQWHIGCTGFHDGQRIDDHQFRAMNHHTDSFFPLELVSLHETGSQTVCQRIQFLIGQRMVVEDDSYVGRRQCSLLPEETDERFLTVVIGLGTFAQTAECGFLLWWHE